MFIKASVNAACLLQRSADRLSWVEDLHCYRGGGCPQQRQLLTHSVHLPGPGCVWSIDTLHNNKANVSYADWSIKLFRRDNKPNYIWFSNYMQYIYINTQPCTWVGERVKQQLGHARQTRKQLLQKDVFHSRVQFILITSFADTLFLSALGFRSINCHISGLEKVCALWQNEYQVKVRLCRETIWTHMVSFLCSHCTVQFIFTSQ